MLFYEGQEDIRNTGLVFPKIITLYLYVSNRSNENYTLCFHSRMKDDAMVTEEKL